MRAEGQAASVERAGAEDRKLHHPDPDTLTPLLTLTLALTLTLTPTLTCRDLHATTALDLHTLGALKQRQVIAS